MPADPCKQLKLEVQPTFFKYCILHILNSVSIFKASKMNYKALFKYYILFILFYMSYISTCFKFKQRKYIQKKTTSAVIFSRC